VNEKKNTARERAKNAYKIARTEERRLFRKKARQLDEEASIEIERHWSIQDSRKFYKRLTTVRIRTTSGYVSSQERGTINQQKPSACEMERTF
jgi:hypothetical protein